MLAAVTELRNCHGGQLITYYSALNGRIYAVLPTCTKC